MKSRRVERITDLIGHTPAVRLNRLASEQDAEIYVKLEYFNPSGSLKDRAASNLIAEAERAGRLGPGATIIEPTSGNTGIGLAMNAAAKGYRLIITMPANMTRERINLLKAYGAEVVLTPKAERMPGAIRKALELQRRIPGSFVPQQFENPANPDAHRTTTALEILEQMDGELDVFIAPAGTGGTITGTGEVLRKHLPSIRILVIEPAGSPVLSGGEPGPHKLVGAGPGFVPSVLNREAFDEIVAVRDEDAIRTSRELAAREGILVGPSSGASVWTALREAKRLGRGRRILCIAPDNGERYLSSDLFESVEFGKE
ncbi:cysteine synthase A [Paenibacillus sp. IB182496]|uniref:cysteine synthase n=1 Tax=Paenibacillus sabuli TaxID=2772509 RepID=A0A927BTX7_9BACL|nr:cysteine synthase A [Paenibacillus sabuli]MBD2846748.1 cysteine synthase A [Paenibacillus sabuli]